MIDVFALGNISNIVADNFGTLWETMTRLAVLASVIPLVSPILSGLSNENNRRKEHLDMLCLLSNEIRQHTDYLLTHDPDSPNDARLFAFMGIALGFLWHANLFLSLPAIMMAKTEFQGYSTAWISFISFFVLLLIAAVEYSITHNREFAAGCLAICFIIGFFLCACFIFALIASVSKDTFNETNETLDVQWVCLFIIAAFFILIPAAIEQCVTWKRAKKFASLLSKKGVPYENSCRLANLVAYAKGRFSPPSNRQIIKTVAVILAAAVLATFLGAFPLYNSPGIFSVTEQSRDYSIKSSYNIVGIVKRADYLSRDGNVCYSCERTIRPNRGVVALKYYDKNNALIGIGSIHYDDAVDMIAVAQEKKNVFGHAIKVIKLSSSGNGAVQSSLEMTDKTGSCWAYSSYGSDGKIKKMVLYDSEANIIDWDSY